MSNLVENILSENYVSASNIFESRLNEILEKKLYEMKKDIQAEAFGGMTKDDIALRKRLGYQKASDVLVDPRDVPLSRPTKKKKPALKSKRKKKLEEAPQYSIPVPSGALANIAARKQEKDDEEKPVVKPKTVFDRSKKDKKKKQPKISADDEKPKTGVVGRKVKGFVKDYGSFMGRLGSSVISQLGEENA